MNIVINNIATTIKTSITGLLMITTLNITHNVYATEAHGAAKLALKAAVADVQQRLEQIKPNNRLSYIRKKDDNEGSIQIYQYTPKGKLDGIWTPVEAEGTDNDTDEKTWENDALLEMAGFEVTEAELTRETQSSWFFQLPTYIQINVDTKETDDEKAAELSKVITAEFEVAKTQPRFLSYRLYSTATFSPAFAVKVTSFKMFNILKEAWPSGPLVTITQTEDIEGSIGYFVEIDDHTTLTNTNFKLVEVGVDNH